MLRRLSLSNTGPLTCAMLHLDAQSGARTLHAGAGSTKQDLQVKPRTFNRPHACRSKVELGQALWLKRYRPRWGTSQKACPSPFAIVLAGGSRERHAGVGAAAGHVSRRRCSVSYPSPPWARRRVRAVVIGQRPEPLFEQLVRLLRPPLLAALWPQCRHTLYCRIQRGIRGNEHEFRG